MVGVADAPHAYRIEACFAGDLLQLLHGFNVRSIQQTCFVGADGFQRFFQVGIAKDALCLIMNDLVIVNGNAILGRIKFVFYLRRRSGQRDNLCMVIPDGALQSPLGDAVIIGLTGKILKLDKAV